MASTSLWIEEPRLCPRSLADGRPLAFRHFFGTLHPAVDPPLPRHHQSEGGTRSF